MAARLRPAVAADAPAVAAIVARAFEGYIPRIGRKPGPMLDDHAAQIRAGRVTVLEDEAGAVVGMLTLVPLPDAMLLDTVAVSPSAQGRGHGGLLIDAAEAEARGAGFGVLRLYTHVAMVENVALYARRGFRETRRVVEKGFERVYMEKALR